MSFLNAIEDIGKFYAGSVNRRHFLLASASIGASSVLGGADSSGIEAKVHKSLPQNIKGRIPQGIMQCVEYIEQKDDGKSLIGDFLRTYRWDAVITDVENQLISRYNISVPKGLLNGLIMHESRGSPLSIGPSSDVGLWMFIPPTARGYDLNIIEGDSMALMARAKKERYDYSKLAALDQRFDILLSTNAAAALIRDKYLEAKKEMDKAGSKYDDQALWNKVLTAYNAGKPSKQTEYHKKIRRSQAFYQKQKTFLSQIKEVNPEKRVDALIAMNRNYFAFDAKAGVCRYMVIEEDVPGQIAQRFNAQYGNHYQKIGPKDINYDGRPVGIIIPGQVIYWQLKAKKQ